MNKSAFINTIAILSLLLFAVSSYGTSITVTTIQDEDNGSLGGGSGISIREAILYSTAGDTINIPIGTYGLNSELLVSHGLVIIGENPDIMHVNSDIPITWDESIIETSTPGAPFHRLFNVDVSSFGFHMKNITLRGASQAGSAIQMNSDLDQNLTLDYVHILDHPEDTAIDIRTTMDTVRITNSVFRNNSSTYASNDNGGAIHDSSSDFLEIDNCIFESNRSKHQGGAIYRVNDSKITNSTFIGNSLSLTEANISTGGAVAYGDGYHNLANCTFIDNTAERGGGAYDGITSNHVIISNCTFYQNTGTDSGGGIGTHAIGFNTQIINTILVENEGGNYGNYFYPPVITNSIDSDENFDLNNYKSYGEKAIYLAVVEGSTALEGGTAVHDGYYIPTEDQLGYTRADVPDIGAIEKSYDCTSQSTIFHTVNEGNSPTEYKADYAITDENGWTHFCNASGDLMISIDTTNTGIEILPNKVKLQTSETLIEEEDLPSLGSLMDSFFGGLYTEWVWSVDPEDLVAEGDSIKIRSYMHNNVYDAYVTEADNLTPETNITSIQDIDAFTSNSETTFHYPDLQELSAVAIKSRAFATLTSFVSGALPSGYYMEYFTSHLNNGGTYTFTGNRRARWTGAEDSNWNNENNWVANRIATYYRDTYIPGDVLHDPIINSFGNHECQALKLLTNSNLTIDENRSLGVAIQGTGAVLEIGSTLLINTGGSLYYFNVVN